MLANLLKLARYLDKEVTDEQFTMKMLQTWDKALDDDAPYFSRDDLPPGFRACALGWAFIAMPDQFLGKFSNNWQLQHGTLRTVFSIDYLDGYNLFWSNLDRTRRETILALEQLYRDKMLLILNPVASQQLLNTEKDVT